MLARILILISVTICMEFDFESLKAAEQQQNVPYNETVLSTTVFNVRDRLSISPFEHAWITSN